MVITGIPGLIKIDNDNDDMLMILENAIMLRIKWIGKNDDGDD